MVLSVLGILQTVGFSLILKLEVEFFVLLGIIIVQGILFIPIMPLCFDYGCDILFPVGEAQITGTLMTAGQIFGILFVILLICRLWYRSKCSAWEIMVMSRKKQRLTRHCLSGYFCYWGA